MWLKKLNVCYDLGKKRKLQFSTIDRDIAKIAELIHLDVRRLSWFPLRNNVKFMLIVMDDYQRKTWIFVLLHKFYTIIRIVLVIGKMVKHMWTDSSIKLCSKLLNKFYVKEGIAKHRIMPLNHNKL